MSKPSLDNLLAEIGSLAYAELRTRYQEVFRHPASPRLGQDLLRRALAHRVQADQLGDLPPKIEKLLRADTTPRAQNATRKLEPGSQLVREWRGEMHVVDVIEGGFRWRGERFATLSAIAREITGARWSGPRFFGLTGNGSK